MDALHPAKIAPDDIYQDADIVTALESQTADELQAVRALPILQRLAQGKSDREEFRQLLGKLLSFHRPIELQLLTFPYLNKTGFDMEACIQAPVIIRDMLRLEFSEREIHKLPDYDRAMILTSFEDVLGALYALEVMLRDRQALYPLLGKHYTLDDHCGAACFNISVGQCANRWESFEHYLRGRDEAGLDRLGVVEAANRLFANFRECIKEA